MIAIIAILAAILFPIFAKAKSAAQRSACISGMKQWGSAITLYRESNNGFLPQAQNIWVITGKWNYFEALYPYMRNRQIAVCPAQAIGIIRKDLESVWYHEGNPAKGKTLWYGATYNMSRWILPKGKFAPDSLAHIQWSQDNVVVNLDTVDYSGVYRCRMSQGAILFCLAGTWTYYYPCREFPDQIVPGSHQEGSPVLFADMRVGFGKAHQIMQ